MYVGVLASAGRGRLLRPSPDNHYVHLAQSFLAGQLGVLENRPRGTNDWACFDAELRGPCPAQRFSFPDDEAARYRWYVSFPPLPAVILMPAVALFGEDVPDRLFWALFAGLGPALFYVLLRALSESGRSARTPLENLLLTVTLAFGSVYFFTAVQGTVWFAAHVLAVPISALFLLFAVDARRPFWAGLALGAAFLTRPTMLLLGVFFAVEVLRQARGGKQFVSREQEGWPAAALRWCRDADWRRAVRPVLVFSAPLLVVGLLAIWMNHARFDDPFEFGHTFLQIRWRERIEKWGLFHFHYLPKNLAVLLTSMPWISRVEPYVTISRHGLALWVTTPVVLLALWPKRPSAMLVGLCLGVAAVLIQNLCYQNSGWIQFGYRFSLDYMVPLLVAIAVGGRRFRGGVWLAVLLGIAVNAFGAFTFDRANKYYDGDNSQKALFQPD